MTTSSWLRLPAARDGARLVSTVGLATGVALLTRPQRVIDAVAPAFPREHRWLVRLLGLRLVAQHGAVLTRPDAGVVGVAAGVDLLHAASMLPFVASTRYGRAARVSGAFALVSAFVAAAAALRSDRR